MDQMTNRKYLILLGVLLLITASSAIIPASWFGIGDKKNDVSSDLTSIQTIGNTNKNKEVPVPATWKDLAEQAFKDQPDVLAKLKETPISQKDLNILNDPNNLTSSFSKNYLVTSTYLKENTGDATLSQDILYQLTQQEAAKIVPTTYLFKDINVAQAESKDSIKTYGNNLALILKDMITQSSIKADTTGIVDYLNTQNEKSLGVVTNDYKKVDAILKKLLALSVPMSASTYHIITVNQVAAYRDNLYNLSTLATDPLRAKISFENYTKTTVDTLLIYKDMSKYFDIKNIVFSTKDAGYVFTAGYTMK